MFAQGFAQLVAEREALALDEDPAVALRQGCRHFVEFCIRDPVRYQLLFTHTVPGFVPSAESMEISQNALAYLRRWLIAVGVRNAAGLDLMRALLMGLAGEQIANQPGGRRWARHVDDIVDVAVEVARRRGTAAQNRKRGSANG